MTIKLYLVFVVALMLPACIQLGSTTPKQSHYLLEATDTKHQRSLAKGSVISLELVDFPEYLKRPQVVTRHQKNMIHFTDAQRWAQPLETNTIQVIRDHLNFMLPGTHVIIHPWETRQGSQHKIKFMVYKFSGTLDGQMDIDIRWQVHFADGNQLNGHFSDSGAIGNSYPELVDGLNHGLEKLCMELVEAVIDATAAPGR